MKSSWGRSVWDLAAGVAFASSGFALVCVCLFEYIDNWPGGQWFPLWDSHGQQWAEPANRQRHNECELISVALTELIVMAHWVVDLILKKCTAFFGLVALTLWHWQCVNIKSSSSISRTFILWRLACDMWRLLPWIQNCLHPLSHLCLCLPRSHCPANSKIPVLWHSCSILCIVKTTLVLLPPPT